MRPPRALRWLGLLLELVKIRITAVVTISGAVGYLWAAEAVTVDMLLVLGGLLLLACGSAALNQVQDARIDAAMERTAGRPIPSGRIGRDVAGFLGGLLALLGLYLVASVKHQPELVAGLGLLALVWYNVVYYLLKRVTAFAVLPGSLIGALPPIMGWVAGGGHALHPFALLLGSFFFVWQIPHFWLLQVNRAREYQRAGLPAMVDRFSLLQLRRITAVWMLAAAAGGVAFPALAGAMIPAWMRLLMVAVSGWMGLRAVAFARLGDSVSWPFSRPFMEINGYALVIMICLCLSAF